MNPKIIVIPAEGDSAETERWYINALMEHYRQQGTEVDVTVFEYDDDICDADMLNYRVKVFASKHEFNQVEIHAQAGLGASIAYRMLALHPERIARVFFIGGAPSDAMTGIAKIFHRYISRL